jgi:hypothetical protein
VGVFVAGALLTSVGEGPAAGERAGRDEATAICVALESSAEELAIDDEESPGPASAWALPGRVPGTATVMRLSDRRGAVDLLASSLTRAPPGPLAARSVFLRNSPSRRDTISIPRLLRWSSGRGPPAARARAPRIDRSPRCSPSPEQPEEPAMRLFSIAIATALVALCGAPALAGECPGLHAQMEREVNKRVDKAGYDARQTMKEAASLHQAGKHNESVAKYEEAAQIAGVKLERKK